LITFKYFELLAQETNFKKFSGKKKISVKYTGEEKLEGKLFLLQIEIHAVLEYERNSMVFLLVLTIIE